jgi:hypothetical protein
MKKTGRVSAAGRAVQSAAVGQSGLGTEKIGSGSENVITVLIRTGSFVAARTHSPPAWCPIRWSTGTTHGPARTGARRGRHLLGVLVPVRRGARPCRAPGRGAAGVREDVHPRQSRGPVCRADRPRRIAVRELPPGADPPGADQRRVQPRSWPRRVNRQDLVMTAHLPGGEARSRRARTATRVRPAMLEDPSPR